MMSVTITEVLKQAGFDCTNDVEDAKWLFAQFSELDDLYSKAQELLDSHDDYEDFCATQEELGNKAPSWEEWREKNN